jgi:hypothetical protein
MDTARIPVPPRRPPAADLPHDVDPATLPTTFDPGGNVPRPKFEDLSFTDGEIPDYSSMILEDETPVDSIECEKQHRLLVETALLWDGSGGMLPPRIDSRTGAELEPARRAGPRHFAVTTDVGLFGKPRDPAIAPDVLLCMDVAFPTDGSALRAKSFFAWTYRKMPEIVVEVVSNREGEELGRKLRRYEELGVPNYLVHDPLLKLGRQFLTRFHLESGRYRRVEGPVFIPEVGLGAVVLDGLHEHYPGHWMRWTDWQGRILPTGKELAAEHAKRAESEAKRAETEAKRAESHALRAESAERKFAQAMEKLRAAGLDLNGDEAKAE